jgi:enoyl-CoA hydratase/carnithine racemase
MDIFMEDLVLSVQGHTAFIKINRPPNNYFDSDLISQIADFLEEQDKNIDCRSIILHSEGKHFCAGADFTKSSFKNESDAYAALYDQAVRLFRTTKPIIAVIQGAAVGGGLGVALAADFRVACPESRFSANFSKLGFHQGFGTTITLPRAVGAQKAKWMLLTSARLKGKEAFEIGLADYLVEKDNLMEKALELAAEINSAGPLGVQAIRFTVNEGIADEIEKIVKWELSEQDRLRETSDFKEGIKASLERKEPNFKGS